MQESWSLGVWCLLTASIGSERACRIFFQKPTYGTKDYFLSRVGLPLVFVSKRLC